MRQHIHRLCRYSSGFCRAFFLQRDFLRALIAIDAVIHQRGRSRAVFLLHPPVAFFTAGNNVIPGENQVSTIELASVQLRKSIIILKGVVAVTGVRHDQRLHGDGVFFHQVGNAGIRVDHNFMLPASLLTMLIQTCSVSMNFCQNDQCG